VTGAVEGWPEAVLARMQVHRIAQVAYVPDAGLTGLIELVHAAPGITPVPLTTEEEGVAVLAGAWLGGQRGMLLMQSSGVGNCINMLSLVKTCRFPVLALVTMRGEWGEGNPWQVPMGRATPAALALMDVAVLRADRAGDIASAVEAALSQCYGGGVATAVLIGQRALGAKAFQ